MTQLIIGLGNKARHGKDTFATAVDYHYANQHAAALRHGLSHYKPVVVQHLAFADALYREVNLWLSTYGKNWQLDTLKFRPALEQPDGSAVIIPEWVQPTPNAEVSKRAPYEKHAKLLQWWGTEYRRSQDPMYWVKQWNAGINPKANIVLATDMRFLNEAEAVRVLGGFTVQVNRKNVDGTRFIDGSRDPLHPSETQLDGYNYDFEITVKTGDQSLLEEYAITLVHYLRALKGHK